jgi:hypothetical protein
LKGYEAFPISRVDLTGNSGVIVVDRPALRIPVSECNGDFSTVTAEQPLLWNPNYESDLIIFVMSRDLPTPGE